MFVREEREKHHKALALEVKKLKAEVKDICKHFDDTVASLFQKYLKVYTYVKAQVRAGWWTRCGGEGLVGGGGEWGSAGNYCHSCTHT